MASPRCRDHADGARGTARRRDRPPSGQHRLRRKNEAARRLYTRLGYRDAGLEPKRVQGTILVRGRPLEVDDTIVYLVKDLSVDSGRSRSS
jgi:hypothetical protein